MSQNNHINAPGSNPVGRPAEEGGVQLFTIIIFSENLAGVLNQVTNVFTRRQLNIESLNVSPSGTQNVHRYTITCYTTEDIIRTVTKQIEKKIDVIQARYFTSDDIYVMEQALYKIATAKLLENKEISKAIRLHDSKIVEVNAVYSIVSVEGLPETIMSLYHALKSYGCLLQFVSSGVIAVTKSRREALSEFLELREEEFRHTV
ncbi:MAG: acetolactate synthase small subunit [Alloprevotella sp.]|nr:acetolactate synthase small subunit [Alloprevotella sp.]MDY2778504.1 acetolactate synthase small subunit [Alloprevotella sp.]MDY4059657.1 acetolactate synthase small subunit [Alloprevotella sp.]